jgi:putative FmdB family regulatory protein
MTYEYVCTSCGNEWEAEQSISEPALKECPKCHACSAKRQVSGGAGFILKGGGWYADGYGSSSKKPEGGGSSGSTSKPGETAGTQTKTETSTEKSPDPAPTPKGSTTAAA